MSIFGWLAPRCDREARERLLLKLAPELHEGWIPIYICSHCGGLDCGCVAVQAGRAGDLMIWHQIAFVDPNIAGASTLRHLGSLVFEWEAYRLALQSAVP